MFFLTVIAFAALASHPIQQQPACLTALSHLPSVELRDQVEAAATAVCTYFATRQTADYHAARVAAAESARRYAANPVAHYLVGILAIRGRDLRVPDLSGHFLRAGYTQTNAEIEGRRALQRALDLDGGFSEAARALAELARNAIRNQHRAGARGRPQYGRA